MLLIVAPNVVFTAFRKVGLSKDLYFFDQKLRLTLTIISNQATDELSFGHSVIRNN